MPALPVSLIQLDCGWNLLTSLPALPVSLGTLNCRFNQLTSIPSLPASLFVLVCSGNQLTSLPALPVSLTYLTCDNNPLTCLPNLNNVTNLYFANTLVNCLPNYGIVTTSIPSITTIPLCDVFNSNGCDVFWNIEGKTFFDADTNCIAGTNEPYFKNQKLNLYKNGVLDQQTFLI
jgi:Leucine-rich repeat (LRR) protein